METNMYRSNDIRRLLPCESGQAHTNRIHVNCGMTVLIGFLALQVLCSSLCCQTLSRRDGAPPSESDNTIKLAPGDMIDVEVFDTPELSAKVRVTQDGFIDLPVLGEVQVSGMTSIEADHAVEGLLRQDRIMVDPRVTVLITEYSTQGISVLGEVTKPGTYLLLGDQSLYAAISAAGGTTDKAGSTMTIRHLGEADRPETVSAETSDYAQRLQTTHLRPGDVVTVAKAKSIYVIGDVARPGEFLLTAGTSLNVLQVIALAQGANHTASLAKASIVRETETGVNTIHINIDKIAKSQQQDLALMPGDIVVVPRSGTKAFMESALPMATGSTAGAVAAALIYR